MDDQLGRRVTRTGQVLAGQQILAGQVLADRGGHRGVRDGCLGRDHIGDQVRRLSPARSACRAGARARGILCVRARAGGVAGFGEVDLPTS